MEIMHRLILLTGLDSGGLLIALLVLSTALTRAQRFTLDDSRVIINGTSHQSNLQAQFIALKKYTSPWY